jgi:ABC-type uncharacterized transport system fused permease/ATPase subunit
MINIGQIARSAYLAHELKAARSRIAEMRRALEAIASTQIESHTCKDATMQEVARQAIEIDDLRIKQNEDSYRDESAAGDAGAKE